MYAPVNEVEPGDILPRVSLSPVRNVVVYPRDRATVVFDDGFRRDFLHGGRDRGFPVVEIERR